MHVLLLPSEAALLGGFQARRLWSLARRIQKCDLFLLPFLETRRGRKEEQLKALP
jgi:hypothetical protein